MRQRLALGVALATVLVVAGIVLSRPAPRLVATNSHVVISGIALRLDPGQELCATDLLVPRNAAFFRIYEAPIGGGSGPALHVVILRGSTPVFERDIAGGYGARPLDVSLPPRSKTVENARMCFRNTGSNSLSLGANSTQYTSVDIPPTTPDEVRVDLFRRDRQSWWGAAPVVARRFALFKPSFAGSWFLWAVGGAFLLAVAGGVALLWTEGRSLRRRAIACGAVGFAVAGVWTVVTPALQVPDEPVHIGYAAYLARTGTIPRQDLPVPRNQKTFYGGEVGDLWLGLPFTLEGRTSWSAHDERVLRARLDRDHGDVAETSAGAAATYPPMYYGYEAAFIRAGSWLDALDRLYLMRLGSALLAGLTVAFVYLFLREALPGAPWAWTAGALVVAFQPLFGFIGGGVNNDNLIYTAAAAAFFILARCFRSGLTVRRGLALGAAVAAGVLTKPTMFGLLPGVGVGVVALCWRQRHAVRALAQFVLSAGAVVVAAVGGWVAFATVGLGRAGAFGQERVAGGGTLNGQVSYLWQFYLPRLPFMDHIFNGLPVWTVYGQSFVGRFGWAEYGFPPAVNQVALAVFSALALLVAVTLVRERMSLVRRWMELVTYVAMGVGVAVLIGVIGYRYRARHGFLFEQMRYLLPLLPLYALLVMLAARAFGRRWAPAAASVLAAVAMGHSLFALFVTLNRYYA